MTALRVPGPSLRLLVPLYLFGTWELATASGTVTASLLPPPEQVVRTLVNMATTEEMVQAVGATATQLAIGFMIGTMLL